MAQTKTWAIFLMIICTLFTSSAQLLYKTGVKSLEFNLFSIITNWPIILGLSLYGIGAVLVILALRGGEVTVLYPIVTSSYIWVSIGSSYFLGESMNFSKWTGVALIVFGIVLINLGRGKEEGEI